MSVCWVKIDRLLPETQEQLKKISSTRLTVKLGKAGFDPDHLEQLDRAGLLEAVTETMLVKLSTEAKTDLIREARKASQIPLFAGDSSSAASEGGSAAVRLRELELKEKRSEREERQRQAERETKKRKAAREAQKLALKAKQRRLEVEEKKKQREMEERRRERKLKLTREQAERDARLRAEQVRLDREIRLEKLKARQAKPSDVEKVDGQTPFDPSGAGNLAL